MRGYHEEGEEKRERAEGGKVEGIGRENWVGVNEEGIGE